MGIPDRPRRWEINPRTRGFSPVVPWVMLPGWAWLAAYGLLLDEHAKLHGRMFHRMRLDLGGGADHERTTEELLELSTYENPNRALIEKEFDAARYNIISSTSDWPPTLQGVWAGTYEPPWSSDFTHNGNVPSAISSLLMGNTPELMLAYTSYMEWLVPWLEINARRIFGARGIELPSRSTTNGFNNAFAVSFPGQFWVAGAAWAAHYFYNFVFQKLLLSDILIWIDIGKGERI